MATPDVALLPSHRYPGVRTFLEGWNALALESILSPLSDDLGFRYQLLPKSLDKGPMNKQEYREYVSKMIKSFKEHKIEPVDCIEADSRVIIHAHARGTSVTGGAYTNEIIMIFTLDSSGKVLDVKEFVDIFLSSKFFADEIKRRAAVEKSG